uniref:trafficking protein particle complex subunit 2-like protein isoform X2 n=1 Tax=Myxine glutinosa TaxID=7769 RepID=UPI00358FE5AE
MLPPEEEEEERFAPWRCVLLSLQRKTTLCTSATSRQRMSSNFTTLCTRHSTWLRRSYQLWERPRVTYSRYGYVANTKVKFVIVIDSSNTSFRDNEIRSMFRKLHTAYTDVMCNPFYTPGDPIQSKTFDDVISSMMQVC